MAVRLKSGAPVPGVLGYDPSGRASRRGADAAREAVMQVDTAVRSAANTLSFGTADEAQAALDATLGVGPQATWRQRYEASMAAQDRRNAYDRQHRKGAMIAGGAAGVGMGFGVGSGIVGGKVVQGVTRLPTKAKGLIGEGFSTIKTLASGDVPVVFQRVYRLPNGRAPRPDHQTLRGVVVEAKYRTGRHESLRGAQAELQKHLGPKFRHDKWGPNDVRRATGSAVAGSQIGNRIAEERRR